MVWKEEEEEGGMEERRGLERKIKEEGFNASLIKIPVVRQP